MCPENPAERPPIGTDGTDDERDRAAAELVTGERATLFACARCGGTLSRQAPGSVRVICRYCGAATALDEELVRALPDALAPSALPPARRFTIGAFYRHRGLRWQVIGVQRFEGRLRCVDRGIKQPIDAEYTLWWLLNGRRELAYLGDHGGTRFWSEPQLPEVARLPPDDSPYHEYGEWTLVEAVGEFSYRVSRGERHRSVEHARRREGVSVDTWLDERGEPRKIEFSRTRKLDDEEVLAGLGDTAGLALLRGWTRGRDAGIAGIAGTLIALGALLVSVVAPSLTLIEPVAGNRTAVLAIAFLALVSANVCSARGQVLADERATLGLAAPAEGAAPGDSA